MGIAAELGYQALGAFRENVDRSTRSEINHGPRAAIRFDLTPVGAPGWPGGARQSSAGLELSLAQTRLRRLP